jgi:hypothetical protein
MQCANGQTVGALQVVLGVNERNSTSESYRGASNDPRTRQVRMHEINREVVEKISEA